MTSLSYLEGRRGLDIREGREGRKDGGHLRNVESGWASVNSDSFNFEESLGHDEIDCFALDEVTTETRQDFTYWLH